MGKVEYGVYEFITSWSLVLAIPAGLGLPRAVLRFISEYRVRQEWGELQGLLLSSWQFTLGVGLLLCLGATQVISFLNLHSNFAYRPILLVAVWLVPLQALIQLQEDMARGVEDIPLAYAPSKVLWPILMLGSVFFVFHQTHSLTSLLATKMAILTLTAAIAFQIVCLWIKFDREIGKVRSVYKPIQWMSVAIPLLLDRTFEVFLTQIDILMVGSLLSSGDAGIYSTAAKTAVWTSFILQSLNFVAAPTYAVLHTKNNHRELQKVVSSVTLWIFVPSIVIATSLAIFAKPLLSLFGSGFLEAHWSLKVLLIGYLVDNMCGSVSNLIVMTGHQNKSALVSTFCAILNFALNLLLIPHFGIVGAAIATTSTMIIWNIWLSILLIKHVNINPTIFYSLGIGQDSELHAD